MKQIGAQMYLSEHTVKTYLSRLYDKLGAKSQSHAVSRAYQMGLL